MQSFDCIFNVGGNCTASISGMSEAAGRCNTRVATARNRLGKLSQSLATRDLFKNTIDGINNAVGNLSASDISFDSQMHDLSAIAGVTGRTLDEIEGYARDSAKTFGIGASQAVDGYQLLLLQLSPEQGKYPEALQAMRGRSYCRFFRPDGEVRLRQSDVRMQMLQ